MTSQIEKNTQSTQIKNYKPKECMIFSKLINKKLQKKKKSIGYKIINISTQNDDGSIGKLLIPTERLFSFGMSENEFGGEQTGYSFPLCLWNRDGATKDEKIWIDKFNEIVDNCINHLLDNREDIGCEELTKQDLKKFNPLYWKKETVMKKGKKVLQNDKTQAPTLYPKIEYSKKNDSFFTCFYNHKTDKEIDAKSLIGKRCFIESTIKIDSIHFGTSISLQVKLNDANIEFLKEKGKNKRFTKRPKIDSKVYIDDKDENEEKEKNEDDEVEDEGDEDEVEVEDD